MQTPRVYNKANTCEDASGVICFYCCLGDGTQRIKHLKSHNSSAWWTQELQKKKRKKIGNSEPLRWCKTMKDKSIPEMQKLGFTLARQLLASGAHTGRRRNLFFCLFSFIFSENLLNLQTMCFIDTV